MVRFNKKEKIIFWLGILTGIVGGAVGNFWVGSYYKLTEDFSNVVNWIGFIIFTLIFLGLIFYINSKLNHALSIKAGRPKIKK